MEINPRNKSWGKEHNMKKADIFGDVLKRVYEKTEDEEFVTRVTGKCLDVQINKIKPGQNYQLTHGPKAWDKNPETEAEKALFYGYHVHSSTNPYGLHTHLPGGELGGAHLHGPATPFGKHNHNINILEKGPEGPYSMSGKHVHNDPNRPDGSHEHNMNDFG